MPRAHFYDVIQDQNGNVIAGATVWVYEEGTTTPVAQSMYAVDSGGIPLAIPLLTDVNGKLDFYLDIPQDVDLQISKVNYTTQTLSHISVGIGQLPSTVTNVFPFTSPVVGTDPRPSPSDHAHGNYPWATIVGTPIQIGDIGSTGSANQYGRSDHTHNVPVTAPAALVAGSAGAGGSNASHNYGDHAHSTLALPYGLPTPAETYIVGDSGSKTLWTYSVTGNSLNGRKIRGKVLGWMSSGLGSTSGITMVLRFGGVATVTVFSVGLPNNYDRRALLYEFSVDIAADGTTAHATATLSISPTDITGEGGTGGSGASTIAGAGSAPASQQTAVILNSTRGNFTTTKTVILTAQLSSANASVIADLWPCMLEIV